MATIMANIIEDITEKKKEGYIIYTHSSNISIALLGLRQRAGYEENMETMCDGKSHDIADGTKTVLDGNIDLDRDL